MLVYKRNPYWLNAFAGQDYNMNNGLQGSSCRRPATNITERDDDFLLQMVLPGYEKTDIIIDVDNQILQVSSKKETPANEKETVLKREFITKPFERKFELPESVDTDKIEAELKDGILMVVIPKMEYAKAKPPREIAIA